MNILSLEVFGLGAFVSFPLFLPLSVSLLLLVVCLHQFSITDARASGPCVCHNRGALWGGCGPPAALFGIMSASEAADGSSLELCPSFAVICSFLERYGALLDLPEVSFPELERSLQESSAGEPLLHCCSSAVLYALISSRLVLHSWVSVFLSLFVSLKRRFWR